MANSIASRLNPNIALLINALLFQCVWWGIVLSHNITAWLFGALYWVFHIFYISRYKWLEASFVLFVACVGISADLVWFSQGFMLDAGVKSFPLWLVPMWVAFATTLPHSLWWLAKYKPLAALFGAIFGPLSYWAGAQFTEVSIPTPVLSLAVLALFWALALPSFLHVWSLLDLKSKSINRIMG